MKLDEILLEDNTEKMPDEVVKFLEQYDMGGAKYQGFSHRRNLKYENGTIMPRASIIEQLTVFGGKPENSQKKLWEKAPFNVDGFDQVTYWGLELEDLKTLFGAKERVIFVGCDIKSLEGIENFKSIKSFEIHNPHGPKQLPINLLPLMKLPQGCVVIVKDMNDDGRKLQEIIKNRASDRVVEKFQEDLSKAGFGKYADKQSADQH